MLIEARFGGGPGLLGGVGAGVGGCGCGAGLVEYGAQLGDVGAGLLGSGTQLGSGGAFGVQGGLGVLLRPGAEPGAECLPAPAGRSGCSRGPCR